MQNNFITFVLILSPPNVYQTPKLANMKKHFFFFILLLFPLLAAAQTYKYIGVEDGLSNRRVYAIQRDLKATCGSSRTMVSTVTTGKSSSITNSWTERKK